MFRAVSLEWLEQLVQDNAGTTHSWEVGKEFMNEEDGGGQDGTLTVTPENLEMHRTKRSMPFTPSRSFWLKLRRRITP